MDTYNPKNPDAFKPEDEFKQDNLPEPAPEPLNITPVPDGSVVDRGSISSPNYRKGQIGWKLSSDGSFEAVNGTFVGTIEANDGTIGGFTIGDSTIVGGNLTLNSAGYFECVQTTGKVKLSSLGLEFIVGSTVNANILLYSNNELRFTAGGGSGGADSAQIDFLQTASRTGKLFAVNSTINLGDSGSGRLNTIYLVNTPDVSSDPLLKDEIRESKYGLKDLLKIKPIQYKIKDQEAIGFNALEIGEIIPEIASNTDKPGEASIRPMELIPILVSAIKELTGRVEILEDKIKNLTPKI